ncbi:hypothetical protein Sango_1423200 [Sesamum angolense]|uniref:Zinc finger, CCHC-type n=1 Tax=Sesamum angolense TaxID=2727404 RepID=A0AAE1WUL8_9LAMI|nr:hypothetical protein Sango_1423200 [Sesamum angolense]
MATESANPITMVVQPLWHTIACCPRGKAGAERWERPVEVEIKRILSHDCKSPLGVIGKEIQNRGCRLEEVHNRKVFEFKMVDSKTVMNQVQEFQMILHDLYAEGMKLSESFQVATMIEKLPPLWKDFKNYLKHKRKEMGLEDLIVILRIEEDNRLFEMKFGKLQIELRQI